jgi:hypothetical protein
MAKSSVAQKLSQLPRIRHGSRITDGMNAKQRQLFNEWIEEYKKTPRRERPTHEAVAVAMSEDIGFLISKYTLARYLCGK